MTTSMYFSSEQIQVLQGKMNKGVLLVQKAHHEPIPEGSIINGVITNEAAVFRGMENIVAKMKLGNTKIHLIVDSKAILVKRLCVPILPEKNLQEITKGEFSETQENYQDLIYDYGVISRKNKQGDGGVILCSAMESALAFHYIDIFKRCKLNLSSIDLAMSGAIGLGAYLPDLKDTTYILSVLDGNSIVSILFVHGDYHFANRTRLFAQRGTPEATREISQAISSLVQFNQAQKTGADISHVYFCGVKGDETDLLEELSSIRGLFVKAIPNTPAVQVDAGIVDFRLADYYYATGNLLIKDGSYHG